ncbi:MAG: hypothetical protein ACR2NA_05685 [Solirubrobacterales bacterium]
MAELLEAQLRPLSPGDPAEHRLFSWETTIASAILDAEEVPEPERILRQLVEDGATGAAYVTQRPERGRAGYVVAVVHVGEGSVANSDARGATVHATEGCVSLGPWQPLMG